MSESPLPEAGELLWHGPWRQVVEVISVRRHMVPPEVEVAIVATGQRALARLCSLGPIADQAR